MPRRFRFVLLASPLCLGGCGLAPRLQSAFPHPVGAPARPIGSNRARRAPEFDSLSRSLGALDATTFDALIKRWHAPTAQTTASSHRAAFTPPPSVPLTLAPARFLVPTPLVPTPLVPTPLVPTPLVPGRMVPGRTSAPRFPAPTAPGFETRSGAAPLEFLSSRTVRAVPVPSYSQGTADVRAFLSGWAARQSLARADEGFLERRALNERIALLSRASIPNTDLSLVSPEVQLELTNLRLELLPLLSVSPAQKARAQQRIEAIEARLRQVWEAETARQAQVRRVALEEVPARLSREGETALQQNTRAQARLDQQQRAQVRDAQANVRPPIPPSLSLRQSGTIAPDAAQVRVLLQAPFAAPSSPSNAAFAPLHSDISPLAQPGAVPSASASRLAQQQERVWRAAIR